MLNKSAFKIQFYNNDIIDPYTNLIILKCCTFTKYIKCKFFKKSILLSIELDIYINGLSLTLWIDGNHLIFKKEIFKGN